MVQILTTCNNHKKLEGRLPDPPDPKYIFLRWRANGAPPLRPDRFVRDRAQPQLKVPSEQVFQSQLFLYS